MGTLKTKVKGVSIVLGVIFLSAFIGCQTEELNQDKLQPNISESVDGDLVTLEWRGGQIQAIKEGDLYLIDDIIIDGVEINTVDGAQTGLSSVGVINSAAAIDRLWPNNIVYYVLGSASNSGNRITNAIEHWEENTNLSFIERTNETNYVEFTSSNRCATTVGMLGGRQLLNLNTNCNQGTVIHEIGHTIGFWHEQTRSDRDDFITINFDNINDGAEVNFTKWEDNDNRESADLTRDFDFDSRMLYDPFNFSSNGEPTITRKNGSTYEINDSVLSKGDIEGANELYPATEITIRASNGKYVSSRGGTSPMIANRDSPRARERFIINFIDNDTFVLKSSNGKYMSSEGGSKSMNANRATPARWEIFTLERISGNRYAIKASNGKYVSGENGREPLIANRDRAAAWEIFEIDGL